MTGIIQKNEVSAKPNELKTRGHRERTFRKLKVLSVQLRYESDAGQLLRIFVFLFFCLLFIKSPEISLLTIFCILNLINKLIESRFTTRFVEFKKLERIYLSFIASRNLEIVAFMHFIQLLLIVYFSNLIN